MNNFKNLLIAVLTGLLALSLFTQFAHSAPKIYDALKLAEYSACLAANNNYDVLNAQKIGIVEEGRNPLHSMENCKDLRP